MYHSKKFFFHVTSHYFIFWILHLGTDPPFRANLLLREPSTRGLLYPPTFPRTEDLDLQHFLAGSPNQVKDKETSSVKVIGPRVIYARTFCNSGVAAASRVSRITRTMTTARSAARLAALSFLVLLVPSRRLAPRCQYSCTSRLAPPRPFLGQLFRALRWIRAPTGVPLSSATHEAVSPRYHRDCDSAPPSHGARRQSD